MSKTALIAWGGWDGHTPDESSALFERELTDAGFTVTREQGASAYDDGERLKSFDLIVQVITMGKISNEQWKHLDLAVKGGTGFAGFHGGAIDSFRENTEYQWMTGGQWVSHPGNCDPSYAVRIVDHDHAITKGLEDFTLPHTEQYYCHIDPGVHVLCHTVFTGEHGDASLYEPGTAMPYAWTKKWGKGKVFIAAWGHTFRDFDVPEAKEIVVRGCRWAAG